MRIRSELGTENSDRHARHERDRGARRRARGAAARRRRPGSRARDRAAAGRRRDRHREDRATSCSTTRSCRAGTARSRRSRTGFAITDLGSRNGTVIDGVAVGKVVAPPGVALRIGKTLVQLMPADEVVDIPPSTSRSVRRPVRRLASRCARCSRSSSARRSRARRCCSSARAAPARS